MSTLRGMSYAMYIVGLVFCVTVVCTAQPHAELTLQHDWSLDGMAFTPFRPFLYNGGTRMLAATQYKFGPDNDLILFNLENGKRIKSFGEGRVIRSASDSLALLSTGEVVRLVRTSDGTTIDTIRMDHRGEAVPLSPDYDTLAIVVFNRVSVVKLSEHDTLWSGTFPYAVVSASRIMGTDSLVVAHGYTDHPQREAPTIRGGFATCSMRDIKNVNFVSRGHEFYYALGRSALTWGELEIPKGFYNRRTMQVVPRARALFVLESGDYVRVNNDTVFSISILSPELDSIASMVLSSSDSSRYFLWSAGGAAFRVAIDSVVWQIDARTMQSSSRPGVPILAKYASQFQFPNPYAVPYIDSTAGLVVVHLDSGRLILPFDIDLRNTKEIKPSRAANRTMDGKEVFDISNAGTITSRKKWQRPSNNYSYHTDTWWKVQDSTTLLGTRTLDTVPTIQHLRHTARIVDLIVQGDGNTYIAADSDGGIIEWEMPNQRVRRILRRPSTRSGAQLYQALAADDSTIAFVERSAIGHLVFGTIGRSGTTTIVTLDTAFYPSIDYTRYQSVLCAGPSSEGAFFIHYPGSRRILIVRANNTVDTSFSRPLRGLVTVNDGKGLVASDSQRVFKLDMQTCNTLDSAHAYASYFIQELERASDSTHVLLRTAEEDGLVLLFNLKWMDTDGARPCRRIQQDGISIGDGDNVLMYANPNNTPLLNIRSGIADSNRFHNWLPAETIPGTYQEVYSSRVQTSASTSDTSSTVVLLHGARDVVLCRSRKGRSVHYHQPITSTVVNSFANDKYIEVYGIFGSWIIDAESQYTVARVDPLLGASAVMQDGPDSEVTVVVPPTNTFYVRQKTFTRRLGTPDEYGNLLQYVTLKNLDTVPLVNGFLMRDALHFTGDVDSFVVVMTTATGVALDSIHVPFKILQRLSSADGRLLAFVGYRNILLYDVRATSIVGITNQFENIQQVRWAADGYKLFITYNNTRYGSFEVDRTILDVQESGPVNSGATSLACSVLVRVEEGAIHLTQPPDMRNSIAVVFDLHGNEILRIDMANATSTRTALPLTSSQLLIIRIESGSSVCSTVVPFIR